MHDKPNMAQIRACHPWLEAEIKVVEPRLVVALGASAAQILLGPNFRLTQHRGEIVRSDWAGPTMATYHPSAILRAPDHDARARMRRQFTDDLRHAAQALSERV
jgi:DNA polymerase